MISVAMTTYNGEQYVIDQLISLRDQSVKIDELIIADDGSTDNTVQLVQEFIENNGLNGWKIEVNEQNKGWRKNFVDVISRTSGDLIFFCDQDDFWMKDKIRVMSETMERHPDIDVLAGRYTLFEDSVPDRGGAPIDIEKIELRKIEADHKLLNTVLPGCVYCVRAKFWRKIIRHWDGLFAHDAICWSTAKLLGTLYVLETPVIYWRNHRDSAYATTQRKVKTTKNRIPWLQMIEGNTECLEAILKDFEVSDDVITNVHRYEDFHKIRIKMLEKHNPFLAFKLLKYMDCFNSRKQLLLETYLALTRK